MLTPNTKVRSVDQILSYSILMPNITVYLLPLGVLSPKPRQATGAVCVCDTDIFKLFHSFQLVHLMDAAAALPVRHKRTIWYEVLHTIDHGWTRLVGIRSTMFNPLPCRFLYHSSSIYLRSSPFHWFLPLRLFSGHDHTPAWWYVSHQSLVPRADYGKLVNEFRQSHFSEYISHKYFLCRKIIPVRKNEVHGPFSIERIYGCTFLSAI